MAYGVDGVSFGSGRIGWVLAAQLMVRLEEFTEVDLEAEHAAYLRRAETRERDLGGAGTDERLRLGEYLSSP
ncbi:hypothetical protein [Streptomyces lushanensis]|uniref:hypothetical protein n=1 Tax=Streptomyces lushanensis TaxID=1434255 RepID=UPI0008324589|nr:hypothetical protein [Streptomyces lushanensis]